MRFCTVTVITRLHLVKEHPSCQAAKYNAKAKYGVTLLVPVHVIFGTFLWVGIPTQTASWVRATELHPEMEEMTLPSKLMTSHGIPKLTITS